MVSDGEYVVKASATAQHRPLLDAINAGRLPKFADGGLITAPRAVAAPLPAVRYFDASGMGSARAGSSRPVIERHYHLTGVVNPDIDSKNAPVMDGMEPVSRKGRLPKAVTEIHPSVTIAKPSRTRMSAIGRVRR